METGEAVHLPVPVQEPFVHVRRNGSRIGAHLSTHKQEIGINILKYICTLQLEKLEPFTLYSD